jgi:hypothetical protein
MPLVVPSLIERLNEILLVHPIVHYSKTIATKMILEITTYKVYVLCP